MSLPPSSSDEIGDGLDDISVNSFEKKLSSNRSAKILMVTRSVWISHVAAGFGLVASAFGGLIPDICLYFFAVWFPPIFASGANTVHCQKHNISAKEEIHRFILIFKVGIMAGCFGVSVLPGITDTYVFLCLCIYPQVNLWFHGLGRFLGYSRTQPTMWLATDALPFFWLSYCLRVMKSDMGGVEIIFIVFFVSVISHMMQESLGVDLTTVRQLLSEALEKSHRVHLSLQRAHTRLAQERRAMARMLSGVFDCRLNMNDMLGITDPSPQLNYLLGREGKHEGLFGVGLDNFPSPSDAKRLKGALSPHFDEEKKGAREHTPASCTQVDIIVHAGDRRVPVVLYHTRLTDSEHTVAVRLQKPSEPDGSESPARRDEESHQPVEDDDRDVSEKIWIEFDAAHPNLLVHLGSEEFHGHANAGLLDWIRSSRHARVVQWVSSAYDVFSNGAASGQEGRSSTLLYFELKLDLAVVTARKAWLECLAPDDSLAGVEKPVRLWLENLDVRWHKQPAAGSGNEDKADLVSEVGVGDSVSQVGHLFFISNKP